MGWGAWLHSPATSPSRSRPHRASCPPSLAPPPPFSPPPLPHPQDDSDPEMSEYVTEVRSVILDAWEGVFSAYIPAAGGAVEETARAQSAAAAALSSLPGASSPVNVVTDVLRTLSAWAAQAQASRRATEEASPYLKKAAALLGDVAQAVGTTYLTSLGVSARTPWAHFLVEEALREELAEAAANDEPMDAKNTMAAYARRMLPK